MTSEEDDQKNQQKLTKSIARVLDEAKSSNATHIRKLKDLSALLLLSPPSHSPSLSFSSAFAKSLTPLFAHQRRSASADRIVRFVSAFACGNGDDVATRDSFMEAFLRFLVGGTRAVSKAARCRACQIISEIIMRLPDDAEVSNEVWDEVIESMMVRVGDKVAIIRTFAVRALSRFVNDSENSDILDLLMEKLPLEQNADVRKAIVLSLPPSNATLVSIMSCTLDVNEFVRKAAYCVLASKFPLHSLSIKLRTTILQRGLADRSVAVKKECQKLMKEDWLMKSCNGDLVELLKYLDVETYESVSESVMRDLLEDGIAKVQDGQSIRKYIGCTNNTNEAHGPLNIQLMEAEVALFWRTVCRHLQNEAQAKGSEAASTTGTEAAVYAEEASNSNDILERVLPETVSEYIDLVKAHLDAGPNYRFASRQLLLLGSMLDFSDVTNQKAASSFVRELLHKSLDYEVDENNSKIVIGDGINLGGDKDWAFAVSQLAKKVHSASGEFEEVVLSVLEELARPCRERTADSTQWMHCLAVVGLLLENTNSFRWMIGRAIEPAEIMQSLLLPGAKHVDLDVQRVATRCLGLFGLLEGNPSEQLVKQLRLSLEKGPSPISVMACKALIDLALWHGPQEVDKAMARDPIAVPSPDEVSDSNEESNIKLLDLLLTGFDRDDWCEYEDVDENESVQVVLGEGFAKVLLLSESYPSIPASSHPLILTKLIGLYFSDETKTLHRFRQCLSVFFEHYPCLSKTHKGCVSKTFIPVMRELWPGINGNTGGSSVAISNLRKRAVQASRFMLQMMQAPIYEKETKTTEETGSEIFSETVDDGLFRPSADFEHGEEGLAIRIVAEISKFYMTKKAAEKTYIAALCRILILLQFPSLEQGAIKLLRKVLNHVAESVASEKELVKELKRMAERLKGADKHPDHDLTADEVNVILEKLEVELNVDMSNTKEIPPTPAPRSARPPIRSRRRRRQGESSSDDDEEEENDDVSPKSVVPTIPGISRSQRASKTAARSKMTASRIAKIHEDLPEEDEEQGSEVTSEEDSGESDQ